MTFLEQLLAILWLLFIAYWAVFAMKAKQTIQNPTWWKGAGVRVIVFVIIILLFHTHVFQTLANSYTAWPHEFLSVIGVIMCVLGLGFAVWARMYLGRNWGMPMTLKKDAELVTTGPYAQVRHPIYAGMLLAVLGSSLVEGLWWLVFFIFFVIYFAFFSIRAEEKIMMEKFPKEYPEYRKRTKMLIPFIL